MNMQNDLRLSGMGGHIPKPQRTMTRAMPWIPEVPVDSRQALHDHNLETLKSTVRIAPPAPRPLYKREQEFHIPYGAELMMQQQYGHKVKIHQPVRQMYNRPSVPLHNPNSIYPPDFNEAQLLNRPKPTIRGTFENDLEVVDRRQFKYDAIQVDARPAMIRGGKDNAERTEVIPLHADAMDQPNFRAPAMMGLKYQEQQVQQQAPTLTEYDNKARAPGIWGTILRDDRTYVGGEKQSYQGDMANRTNGQLRSVMIADREMQKAGAGHASLQTHSQHISRTRGVNLKEDRHEHHNEERQLGTEIDSFQKANLRSVRIQDRGFQKNETGHSQETHQASRMAPHRRGMTLQDRKLKEQDNVHPTVHTQQHVSGLRGLKYQEREFEAAPEHVELGTTINTSSQHGSLRGLSIQDDREFAQHTSNDFEYNNNGFSAGTILGTSIKDDRSESHSDHADLRESYAHRSAPSQRGLKYKENDFNNNDMGGSDLHDGRMMEPDNSVRMKFQIPRMANKTENPIVETNEQRQGPLYTSIRPQKPRSQPMANAPVYNDPIVDRQQQDRVQHRRAAGRKVINPGRYVTERQEAQLNLNLDNQHAPAPLYHRRSVNSTPAATPDWRPPSYRDNREEAEFIRKNFNLPNPF
jgi:hypothetical protein